jgi:hypothetical protein
MSKPSSRIEPRAFRNSRNPRGVRADVLAGFPETQFSYDEDDEDYSGFAPTQLSDSARRGAAALAGEPAARAWTAARASGFGDAGVREAADRAHALISAQRRGEPAPAPAPSRLARLHRALRRALPGDVGSMLLLLACVTLTMALISALLPLFDKP